MNLIGNAIKFTSEGSINITCDVSERNGQKVKLKFSIADTGIGISADKLDKIFDRFTQADSDTTRNFGGTGLGLSIAKKLVEIQEGKINVHSALGKGSDFVFVIEYEIAQAVDLVPTTSAVLHSTDNFKGKKILIVEDNPLNQKLNVTYLNSVGFLTTVAENGEQAFEILKKETFYAILMDLQMPVMDGFQATRKIRHELKLRTPIIAMTANAMTGERERCISSGMDDYITKPFKSTSLFILLSKFIDGNEVQSKQTTTEKPAGTKITSLAYLEEFTGGDKAMMKDIAKVFLDQNPKDLDKLEKALREKDLKTIKAIAHTLQTSMGFLGLPDHILKEIKEVEAASMEPGKENLIAEKLPSLIAICRQAQEEVKEVMK
jgi:CheY-like chemotaxis protein